MNPFDGIGFDSFHGVMRTISLVLMVAYGLSYVVEWTLSWWFDRQERRDRAS